MDAAFSLKFSVAATAIQGGALNDQGNLLVSAKDQTYSYHDGPPIWLTATGLLGMVANSAVDGQGDSLLQIGLGLSGTLGPVAGPTLPALTLAASVIPGNVMSGEPRLSPLALTGTGLAGAAINGSNLPLPALTLAANMAASAGRIVLPALGLSGSILTGAIARAPNLPVRLSVSGSAVDTDAIAMKSGAMTMPALRVSGSILPGGIANFARPLIPIRLTGSVIPGGVALAEFSLPVLELAARGYTETVIGSGLLSIPLALDASIVSTAPVQGIALVMNTRLTGVTTYSAFPFNSMANFQGESYGAAADGIYALVGDDDAGTSIAAVVVHPITDSGATVLKRVVAAYIAYRAAGPLELRLKTDDNQQYRYRLEETPGAGIHRNRVKTGRGAKANYWQASVANINGCDFQVERVELEEIALPRKIG